MDCGCLDKMRLDLERQIAQTGSPDLAPSLPAKARKRPTAKNLIFAEAKKRGWWSRMSEKKAVNRNVAIGIGALCIVLLVAIIGLAVYYTSVLNNKDSQMADLKNQITFANSTIDRLTAIVNLSNSTIWVNDESINQPAGNFTSWSYSIKYAGYAVVDVLSSSTSNTYVELSYSWNGVNYDNTVNVGSGGSAWFPVLPANNIGVWVINKNFSSGASETVTITYWY
jgi:hypothetical protein